MFGSMVSAVQSIVERVRGVRVVTPALISEVGAQLRAALIEADVPAVVIDKILSDVAVALEQNTAVKGIRPHDRVLRVLNERLLHMLGEPAEIELSGKPQCCMVVGLQGAGKTTTLVKLAKRMLHDRSEAGSARGIMLASVDFGRPAAREQLQQLATRHHVSCYLTKAQEPVAAAQEAWVEAQRRNVDLFLDTAGRLHTDAGLMKELQAIVHAVKPAHRILVLDGMMGQEALSVAQQFHDALDISGGIITKLDSDARGGVVLSFRSVMQRPIFWIGTGEHAADLERFVPERAVKRMLGEGDLASFMERAQTRCSRAEQEAAEKAASGAFTYLTFQTQLRMMQKIGSLQSMLGYLPGMGSMNISREQLAAGERDFKKFAAMIDSMTVKERRTSVVLNANRQKRIAKGAGVSVEDVRAFMRLFQQTQHLMGLMGDGKRLR